MSLEGALHETPGTTGRMGQRYRTETRSEGGFKGAKMMEP